MSEQKLSDAEREELRALVREMLEEAEVVLDAVPTEEQPHSTEEDVAVCYARLGDFASARRLVDRWSDQYDRVEGLTTIAICQRQYGAHDDALETLDQACAASHNVADRDSGIDLLASIARLLIEWRESDRARRLLIDTSAIAKGAIDPTATSMPSWVDKLVGGYVQLLDFSTAKSLADELLRNQTWNRDFQLCDIAIGLAKAGSCEQAIKLAESISNLLPRTRAIHGIADSHPSQEVAAGMLRACAEAYGRESNAECRAGNLEELARSMHLRSLNPDALRTLRIARDALLEMSSYYYRTLYLSSLASNFAEFGDLQEAYATLDIAEQVTDTNPYIANKSIGFMNIAAVFHKLGDFDKAESRFEAAAEAAWLTVAEDKESWIIDDIVREACDAGYRNFARSITERLVGDRRASALLQLAEPVTRSGVDSIAYGALAEAIEVNERLSDSEVRAQNERWISVAYIGREDLDTAIRFARKIDRRFVVPSVMAFVDIASNLLDRLGAPTHKSF